MVCGPEQLAQRADLHLQVVLLDHHARPHQVEQLGLGDEPVAPLDQRQQHIEGARTNARGAAFDQQLPLAGPHFDSAKTQRFGQAKSWCRFTTATVWTNRCAQASGPLAMVAPAIQNV